MVPFLTSINISVNERLTEWSRPLLYINECRLAVNGQRSLTRRAKISARRQAIFLQAAAVVSQRLLHDANEPDKIRCLLSYYIRLTAGCWLRQISMSKN